MITAELECEGVERFDRSYRELLDELRERLPAPALAGPR